MDNFWMVAIVFVLLFVGFGGYVILMIFWPEWVGITGKEALRTMREHEEGALVDDRDIYTSEGLSQPNPLEKNSETKKT